MSLRLGAHRFQYQVAIRNGGGEEDEEACGGDKGASGLKVGRTGNVCRSVEKQMFDELVVPYLSNSLILYCACNGDEEFSISLQGFYFGNTTCIFTSSMQVNQLQRNRGWEVATFLRDKSIHLISYFNPSSGIDPLCAISRLCGRIKPPRKHGERPSPGVDVVINGGGSAGQQF